MPHFQVYNLWITCNNHHNHQSKDSGVMAMHTDMWVIQGLACPGCWLLRRLLASGPSLPHTTCRFFSNLFSQNCTSKVVWATWGPANPYSLHFSRLHHHRSSPLSSLIKLRFIPHDCEVSFYTWRIWGTKPVTFAQRWLPKITAALGSVPSPGASI